MELKFYTNGVITDGIDTEEMDLGHKNHTQLSVSYEYVEEHGDCSQGFSFTLSSKDDEHITFYLKDRDAFLMAKGIIEIIKYKNN